MIPVIDMHCDTISAIYKRRWRNVEACLRDNTLHLDLKRMKEAGYMGQCFALFTYMPSIQEEGEDPFEYAKTLSETLDAELAANADLIRPAYSADDIRQNFRGGFLSAIRTIEEGAVYEGDPEKIRWFYDHGVRMSTLTWNFENELAYPNRYIQSPGTGLFQAIPETERGLKAAGRDAVQLMEELGMLIDVSHLGDAGILEILDFVDAHTPVIASHSNARTVTPHPRNLTDAMLRSIAEHGGVTGDQSAVTSDPQETVKSIPPAVASQPENCITSLVPVMELELNGAGDMQKLADALSAAGFTTGEIEKIFWKNVMRVFEEVLG